MSKFLREAVAATTDKTGKVWRVKLIQSDVQGSSAYYPAEVLERDGAKAFPINTPMYLNHPTMDEKYNQPERDAEKLIGYLSTEAVFETDGLYADAYIYSDRREWVMERAKHVGLSIVARGEVEETADGPRLTSLTVGQSLDLVTKAGAGGKFVEVLESALEISASTSVAESEKKEDQMELPKELLTALDKLVETSTANSEALAKLTERATKEDAAAVEAAALAEAANAPKVLSFSEIDAALTEAELPSAARASVLAAVEAGADLTETVAAKKAEVEAVLTESKGFAGFVSDEGEKSFEESADAIIGNIFGN